MRGRISLNIQCLLVWLIWWIALTGLWLALVGKTTPAELVAGAFSGAIAATALYSARKHGDVFFEAHWRWLQAFARIPGQVMADTAITAAALFRALFFGERVEGCFRRIDFDPGGDDPESAARRALVTFGASIAPNTYVVDLDLERKQIIVHQLVATAQPPGHGDVKWPV